MKDDKNSEWNYSADGLQRWKANPPGHPSPWHVESVPQGESLTRQEFKEDCDVNIILKRILKTGQMPVFTSKTGVYGDFTEVGDYRQAMDVILKADQMFLDIPTELRQKFNNDPQELINYLNDPEKIEESISLGLRNKPAKVENPILDTLKDIAQAVKPAEPTK